MLRNLLEDKIIWFCFQLDVGVAAGLVEAPGAGSCPVIWERFDPTAPKEVDRILGRMSTSTCVLDPCPLLASESFPGGDRLTGDSGGD